MNGYLLSVIGTVLICSIITAITPDGKTSSVIRNVAKLACTVAILAPILVFFKTGEINEGGESKNTGGIFSQTGIQTDEEFIQYYCEFRVEETQEKLREELVEKFQVQTQINFLWEIREDKVAGLYLSENIFIQEIQIFCLEQTPQEEKEKIENYVKNTYGCGVRVE